MYAHTCNGPYETLQELIETFFVSQINSKNDSFAYAIIDKSEPPSIEDEEGRLAGLLSYTDADGESSRVELGHARIFPSFQRRGLATIAGGLMLQYALDSPAQGGLGLCRVEWTSSTMSAASCRTAEKLGFREFGLIKYQRIIKHGARRGKVGNGRPNPPGSGPDDLWRDLRMYGITWDEWTKSVRQHVVQLLYPELTV